MNMRNGWIGACLCAVTIAASFGAAAENGFTLAIVDADPPDDAPEEVRAAVPSKAYQVSDAQGVFFEFWLVPVWPVTKIGPTNKDTLGAIEEIELLGIISVRQAERADFRDDAIDMGTYVVRMALQPQDGNHMGTSPFDFFALFMPPEKEDLLKDDWDPEFMVELATEDTEAVHPPILAMQPMDNGDGEFPRMGVDEKEEWHYVALAVPVKSADAEGTLHVKLVIQGIGDIE